MLYSLHNDKMASVQKKMVGTTELSCLQGRVWYVRSKGAVSKELDPAGLLKRICAGHFGRVLSECSGKQVITSIAHSR